MKLHYSLSGLALIVLTLTFAIGVNQSHFTSFIALYGAFFLIYIYIYRTTKKESIVRVFLGLALVLRLLLVFAFPNLSDDIYRFVWDGRLLLHGISPFEHLPTYWISENTQSISGIDRNLYNQLNSPEYFTIYPPVCQAIFAFACWLFPKSIIGSAIVMKACFFAAELGTLLLLRSLFRHFKLPAATILLYALNPLIIWDAFNNLHFEILMIFFLTLGLFLLVRQRWHWSAVSMALAVATKLLPMLLLPLLIQRLGWKRSLSYFSIGAVVLLLLFYPLFSEVFFANFGESLDLYFQRFEFNASLYYLLRWLGYQWAGYNLIALIGPFAALLAGLAIVALAVFEKQSSLVSLPRAWLFAMSLFLLCTTTVHPWYVSSLVLFCLFTPLRYPILWSALIALSYINYSYTPYHENLWVVIIEYGILFGFIIYEMTGKRQLKTFREQMAKAKH